MNWLIFALIPPILWAISNIADKFTMTKIFNRAYFYYIWSGIFTIPVCIIVYIISNPLFSFPYSVIAALVGALYGIVYIIYAKVVSEEEISRVTSLIFISPIFVVMLATIFLKEVLSLENYFGILLLALSGILVSYQKRRKRIFLIGNLRFIILIILLLASVQVVEKFTIGEMGYWSIYFWVNLGFVLVTIPFLFIKNIRIDFLKAFRNGTKKKLSVLITSQIFSALGGISYYVAVFLGPISLISALGSLQPFFVFIITLFLSIFMPKILKENINKQNILLKSIAVLLVLAGTWLIT